MAITQGKKTKRQGAILEILKASGYESIYALAERLDVSEQTIRRDIADLDTKNLARRTHGGVAFGNDLQGGDYLRRRFEGNEAKMQIAEKVAGLVKNGDSVFIDAGTTCAHVASALKQHKRLNIVTYNLNAAHALKDCEDFAIAIPGGYLRHIDGSIMGDFSQDFIPRFNFDISILSCSGIDANGILWDDNQWEVVNATAARERSSKVILAVDPSKFGKGGMDELGPISMVDCIVTTGDLDAKTKMFVSKHTEIL